MNYFLTDGDDTIVGTNGADTVTMENPLDEGSYDGLDLRGGDDVVNGCSDAVSLDAGSGNDQIDYRLTERGDEWSVFRLGSGNDILRIVDDRWEDSTGVISAAGGDGDDWLELFDPVSDANNDMFFYGDAGIDTFALRLSSIREGRANMIGIQLFEIENVRIVTGGRNSVVLSVNASLFSDVESFTFDDADTVIFQVGGFELVTAASFGDADVVAFHALWGSINVDMTGSDTRHRFIAGYEGGQRGFDSVLVDAVDSLTGGFQGDLFDGGLGADLLDGGAGIDVVDYTFSRQAVAVDLSSNANTGGHAEGDVLTDIENVTGSGFDDDLRGDGSSNTLLGGAGDDRLYGRDGDDLLRGGGGADRLNGGAGIDTASYAGTYGVRADLAAGTGHLGDLLVSIENLIGSAHGDLLFGDVGANRLDGGAGNDRLYGRGGDDVLIGGSGHDVLVGGFGSDVLIGGTGADTFEFRAEIGRDTVNDFENGVDHFRLAGFGSFANVTRSTIDADADGRTDDVLVAYARSGHGSGSFAVLNTGLSAIDTADFIFV